MLRASSISNESTDLEESVILNCLCISLLDTPQLSKRSRTDFITEEFEIPTNCGDS